MHKMGHRFKFLQVPFYIDWRITDRNHTKIGHNYFEFVCVFWSVEHSPANLGPNVGFDDFHHFFHSTKGSSVLGKDSQHWDRFNFCYLARFRIGDPSADAIYSQVRLREARTGLTDNLVHSHLGEVFRDSSFDSK